MDKKLSRKILFDKSSQKTLIEPAANPKPRMPTPKIDRVASREVNTSAEVVKWINTHEYFKWSPMCLKIGLDKGNFKRTLESPDPSIPEKYLTQIIAIIKQYGYAK